MKKIWQSEKADDSGKTDPTMQVPASVVPKAASSKIPPRSSSVTNQENFAAPKAAPKSIVGAAMSITGDLEAKEDLLIAGYLEGTISLQDHCLTIAPSGNIRASVKARSLIVEGTIEGDVDCLDSVILKESAHVTGNIRMRRLNLVDGAQFNGKITMLTPDK